MKKKLIAWLLVICMAISLLPAAALADTAAKSGKCGDNVTWTLSNDGTLTISGKGKMYESLYCFWEDLNMLEAPITNIVIENGVTSIADYAFAELSKFKAISIPNSVTQIGKNAFYSCSSLETVTIPDGVKNIEFKAFANCQALKSVALGKNVTVIDNSAFEGCTSLETINFPSKLKNIRQGSFEGCTSLKTVSLPDSLEMLEWHAFYGCPVKNVNIPSNLKHIDNEVFFNGSFDRVDIPAGLTSIGEGSFGCNVKEFYVDDNNPKYTMQNGILWDYEKNIIVACGLDQCLKGYTIGNVYRVNDYAFANCKNLTEILFAGKAPQFGYKAFLNCNIIIDYPNGNSSWASKTSYSLGGKITWVPYDVPATSTPKFSITTDSSTGKPLLKWADDDGALAFVVYRSTSKAGEYSALDTVFDTKYLDTSAMPGRTYYYIVTVMDMNGKEKQSAIKSITCDCARPVVSITTNASSGKPSLKWNAVDGATKYEVYRATSKNGTYTKMYTTTSTSYTNSSAVAGTTYYYKVKAICGKSSYGNSAYSVVKSIKCTPAAPSLSISRVNGKPKLSWKAVSGATKYWIYRSTDGKNFKYYDSTTKTSYTNSGAASGTKYYYKVKAVTVVNGKSVASSYSYAKSLVCTPATPNVSITSANGKPKLSWNAVSGATKYWIYRSTDGKNFKYYDSTTKTTYTNNSTTVGTRYYYKVKAVVVDNGTSYASAFSSAKSMTVRAAAPTLKTSAPEGTPSLSWNAVNGATKYWIYRSTDGKEFKYYDSTTKTAYTNKSVDAGKTYYYKVKAVNVVNGTSYASGFSNSVSVLVK